MDETTKAYLAGFIDADGHISIHKQRDYHYLRVGISNRSERLLICLQKKIGMGKIYLNEKQGPKRNAVYSLLVHGQQAAYLLSEIIDYLILKKEQAEIGLEFAETITHQEVGTKEFEKRMVLYYRIKRLNKRGRASSLFDSPNIVKVRKKRELDRLRQWQGEEPHPYLI